MAEFSFGTDSEFFLTDGMKYVSAIGVVKGTREKRLTKHGHQFFYDNALAECAVLHANTASQVVENIGQAIEIYAEMVRPLRLDPKAAVVLSEEQMWHADARIAGCTKEWSVYTKKEIPMPNQIMRDSNLRTAGGHIHLGADTGPLQDQVKQPFVIYMLDLFLGVSSLFIDKDATSPERRRVYGKAGSYRQKVYGIEYRPLSPFWLTSPTLVRLVYDLCEWVLQFVEKDHWNRFWSLDESKLMTDEPNDAYHCYGYDVWKLRRVIDSCDKEGGHKFMDFIQNYLPNDLLVRIQEEIAKPPYDMYREWGLKV